ncbi:VOC family protein [Kribbella sp. NPDC023972]|uniref:VOC family protein n=1 Tax=Kribbella sp. NPDC023972 TaxID=3154795 RepID=UPI0033E774BE
MTSRLAAIAIDAVDSRRVAEFWCAVLGWRIVEEDVEFISIAGDGPGLKIDIATVPERKQVKNRLHLDVRADGVSTEQELQRLLDLGATHVDLGQPDDATWTVLADPEGNEFCLLHRTVQEVPAG